MHPCSRYPVPHKYPPALCSHIHVEREYNKCRPSSAEL
eukprot:gene3694-6239_t